MATHTYRTTTFLNVDLDLYSSSDLEPLVTALGERVLVLYMGRRRRTYEAHLELAGRNPKSADAAIRAFTALIRKLPRAQRKLWETAARRDFNIGIQVAMAPFSFELPLARETVGTVSALKARIVVTVYAPEAGKTRIRRRTRATTSYTLQATS